MLRAPLDPGPDAPRRDEAGDTSRQVDEVAAAEVQRTVPGPVAAAPQQEGVDRVGEGDPERHEDQPGLEVDPADHPADEQDRRDRGEHELEVDERSLSDPELRHPANNPGHY